MRFAPDFPPVGPPKLCKWPRTFAAATHQEVNTNVRVKRRESCADVFGYDSCGSGRTGGRHSEANVGMPSSVRSPQPARRCVCVFLRNERFPPICDVTILSVCLSGVERGNSLGQPGISWLKPDGSSPAKTKHDVAWRGMTVSSDIFYDLAI